MSFLSNLNDPRLRFAELLGRKGLKLGRDSSQYYSEAHAVRRCVFCKAKNECDAWLASGRQEGFQEFCPNAWYIERRAA
jgi:hypothetical protein